MAQEKPTLLPRWATNPPAGPPTDITEPTSAQKDSGWQPAGSVEFPDGKPVRQIMNWLQNLAHQWFGWLDSSTRRTTDLHEDQALPPGTAPTIAAGLVAGAADFSARVYASGYEVPLTDSPAHVYSANSDTYWDLTRGGTWTPVVVVSGGGEPALTPNAVRVYAVRTDATDRTLLLTDRRRERVDFTEDMDVNGKVRLGGSKITNPDQLEPRVEVPLAGSGGETFTLINELQPDTAGGRIARIYATPERQIVVTWGAKRTNDLAGTWTVDGNTDAPMRLDLGPGPGFDLATQGLRMRQINNATPGGNFNESAWENEGNAIGGVDYRQLLNLGSALKIGADWNQAIGATQVNVVPRLDLPRPNAATAKYSLEASYNENGGSFNTIRVYSTSGPDMAGSVAGVWWTSNCFWNQATSLWNRDGVADCFAFGITEDGLFLFHHPTAGTATWADTVTAATWNVIFSAADNRAHTISIPASAAIISPIALPSIRTGLSGSMSNPVDDAAGIGLLTAAQAGVGNKAALFPVVLPNGALITGARVNIGISIPGSEEVRAALVRLSASNVRTSMKSGTAYNVLADTGGTAVLASRALTIDQSTAIRTVDNDSYSYYLWIGEKAGDLNHVWELANWEVDYTLSGVKNGLL